MDTDERAKPHEAMEPLTAKLEKIRQLIESMPPSDESDVAVCKLCLGTGFEMVPGKGAKRCRCRSMAVIAERHSRIPPRYAGLTLEGLLPQGEHHEKQAKIIETLKANPLESFVFCGRPDAGKTHLMWALYYAISFNLNRRLVACSMLQLINEYRDAFRPREDGAEPPSVQVRPNDLMQVGVPYSLFFDDIDKPKMTEYVAEQIHALFDAAYINKHQIVVTTNLRPSELEQHFKKADPRYGHAIVRRIIHADNNLFEMF